MVFIFFQTLMAQTRERRTEDLSEATWCGRAVPVRPERVRVLLLADRDLDAQCDPSKMSVNDRIERLERHLMDCKDALAAAKEELKNDVVSCVCFTNCFVNGLHTFFVFAC